MIACAGEVTMDGGDYGVTGGGGEEQGPVESGWCASDGIIAAPSAGAQHETHFGTEGWLVAIG
ncbi:MAG TPA: hypothetical protein VN677_01960 [Gemmatimonadaceae bacterium]|nr:hypothetical protein [Gemmatimonadaceae bacterium]